MKFNILALSIIISFFSATAMAGAGHDHGAPKAPVSQDTAKTNAEYIVDEFVKQNKIDKSWASVKPTKIEEKAFEGQKEWMVTFENAEIADASKRKLYVFLTLNGEYVAANHTGK